jgi:hypothetical protein
MPTPVLVKSIAVFAVLAAIGAFVTDFYVTDDSYFWIPTTLVALSGALSYFATSTILLSLTLISSAAGLGLEIWLLVEQAYAVPSNANVTDIIFDSLTVAGAAGVVVTAIYGLDILAVFEPIIESLSSIPTPLETKLFAVFAVTASIGSFVTGLTIPGNYWVLSVLVFLSGLVAFFATSKVLTSTAIVFALLGLGGSIYQVVEDASISGSNALVWQGLQIAGAATVLLVELLTVGFFELFEPVVEFFSSLLSGIIDSPNPLYVKTISLFAAAAAIGLFVSDIVTLNYTQYFWITSIPLFFAGVFSYFATSKALLWTTVVLAAGGVGTSIWELIITPAGNLGGTGVDAIVWESLAIAGGIAVFVSALWILIFRKSSSSYVTLPTYGHAYGSSL